MRCRDISYTAFIILDGAEGVLIECGNAGINRYVSLTVRFRLAFGQHLFIRNEVVGMLSYEKLYLLLFNGITDALSDIRDQDYHTAEDTLIRTQQQAEDYYIRAYEEDPLEPDHSVTVSPVTSIDAPRRNNRDILRPNNRKPEGRFI